MPLKGSNEAESSTQVLSLFSALKRIHIILFSIFKFRPVTLQIRLPTMDPNEQKLGWKWVDVALVRMAGNPVACL